MITAVSVKAAERLARAAELRRPCAPVRELLGGRDIAAAYAVQRGLARQRQTSVVGRKIGLTSKTVQQQLRVDQPNFGTLFEDMDVSALLVVPSGRLLQPKAEAEIAFVLGSDLDGDEISIADVRASIDYAMAAIELVDSRIAGWDIKISDTVADNASSGYFALSERQLTLKDFEPRDIEMTMLVDGFQTSAGAGTECMGDPLAAVLWLARTTRDLGDPLRAGEVVLSGALGPMVAVHPGNTITARFTGLGPVSVTLSKEQS